VARPRDTDVPAALPFPLAVSPDIARHLFDPPISRGHFYKMLERGEVESVRMGQRIVVPLAPLASRFGVDLLERFGADAVGDAGGAASVQTLHPRSGRSATET
jgi:hypothetical protein